MKKFFKIFGISLLSLILMGLAVFIVWAANPAQADAQALEALNTTDTVRFESNDKGMLTFSPLKAAPDTGLIFYPGARVAPQAYAPLAQSIAESGFLVVIVPMPLNFAFFGIGRAADVMADFPEITTWAVGGHSLGGAMAAEFASQNLDAVEGLVLWAAYPGQNNDLSSASLSVISIYASNDGLATPQKIDDSRQLLPAPTQYIEIQGGNHAGFGVYGSQARDGAAEINQPDQQTQIVNATAAFLDTLVQH